MHNELMMHSSVSRPTCDLMRARAHTHTHMTTHLQLSERIHGLHALRLTGGPGGAQVVHLHTRCTKVQSASHMVTQCWWCTVHTYLKAQHKKLIASFP